MSTSRSSPAPRLADHVRACRVGDQLIFLDLHRGKYLGVGGPQSAALSAAVLEDRPDADAPQVASNPVVLDGWIQRLRDQHLLADGPTRRAPGRVLPLAEPVASLNADEAHVAAASDWRDLLRLWHSTLVAAAWLRRHSLDVIAARVVALRTRQARPGAGGAPDALLAAVASYARLSPFALTTHDRCLMDSLTLVHFLAGRGLFPQWVIGVRIHPFAAHSWVQSGGVVLNDLAERVRHYRPILVV